MDRAVPFEVGEYYHIYNRGIEKAEIFRSTQDWERFLAILYAYNTKKSFQFRDIRERPYEYNRGDTITDVIAYALMPNHFHLLLKERERGGISKYMGKVLTSFSMYTNTVHARSGPVMCRPFRSRHIDSDEYFRWVISYIHLNPANVRVRESPHNIDTILRDYRYSSHYDYCIADRIESRILSKEALPFSVSEISSIEKLVSGVVEGMGVDAFTHQEKFLTQ